MSDSTPSARIAVTLPERELAAAAGEVALSQRPGLGPWRIAQLQRDLSLTPEERVRAAEETLRLTESPDQPRKLRPIAFDTYEDFLDWKFSRSLRR